ncbi:hypothetical protein [Caballeronia sp. dw_19]|nr:hypothetical protein [Caballeronia sp. dw_19]
MSTMTKAHGYVPLSLVFTGLGMPVVHGRPLTGNGGAAWSGEA